MNDALGLDKEHDFAATLVDLLAEASGGPRVLGHIRPYRREVEAAAGDAGAVPLVFYRGQSTSSHGLNSSLQRAVMENRNYKIKDIKEQHVAAAEKVALEEARITRMVGRRMATLELLALMQHHLAPTRLMDVSKTALEALYFAVESGDDHDGRLFIISVNPDHPNNRELRARFQTSVQAEWSHDMRDELFWDDYINPMNTERVWTNGVLLITDFTSDPRMISQNGVFLTSGFHRQGGELRLYPKGSKESLRADKYPLVTVFPIGFPVTPNAAGVKTEGWPALAWTITIPGKTKKAIRELLATRGIRHESIYPDLVNLKWQVERSLREAVL